VVPVNAKLFAIYDWLIILSGMIATIINALTVIIGSLIGYLLRRGLSEELKKVVFTSAGVITVTLGLQGALQTAEFIPLLIALILGGLLGTWLKIHQNIENLGQNIHKLVPKLEAEGFGRAFLEASMIFCVGALTILGSIDAGLHGNYDKLLLKSVLDGFMAIVLTSSLGPGVGFSALFILVFQGALTLSAQWLEPLLSEAIEIEIGALGGLMILMIGLDLLGVKKTQTANFLPAIIIIAILTHFSFLWSGINLAELLPFLGD
jgi:uncharacterized membrane protein YqgA involved in biofilm formation